MKLPNLNPDGDPQAGGNKEGRFGNLKIKFFDLDRYQFYLNYSESPYAA